MSAADNGSGTGFWERLRRGLRGPGTLPIGEALHPATLAAVLVLVVNDWVLKRAVTVGSWQHTVTGKLSDVAGLAAAPMVLTAVIGLVLLALRRAGARVDPFLSRRRVVGAIAATGLGFAAIKLSPDAAAWFTRMIGWVRPASVQLDRTDLACLPMLALAYWVGRDELRRLGRWS